MLNLECQIVDRFGWSLNQIDEIDIESLFRFFFYYPYWKSQVEKKPRRRMLFADEANWL